MSATISPSIPADVIALAIERNAEAILPQVVELTQRVFPDCPLRVYVQEDPECADYRQIAVEVKLKPEIDVDARIAARREWLRGAFPLFASLSWPTFALVMVTGT